ncbi:DUF5615 family PIN-like protein [Oscillatoria salina]|uniref:DUF5615 family PIN-like protein n=1 Tax=Oscillatoria salina TaxID=331517 RepID=UPI0013BA134D|nr:DUF5615 family PIN-like protein [Oscillatoria salina]MBZ8183232.1 hypothetical protein [Oscillatoria salina IIICB1]NET88563.1 hypothetical protein [Kamptonema sp. SIO1D9]
MSQICLYLDEDASRGDLIKALRNANIDLITTSEADNLSCSDLEQLVWATANNKVIYTYNMGDYCRLHTIYMVESREHTGIIVAERQSYSIGEQLRGLQRLVLAISAESIRNQLVFLGTYIRNE